jgi:hypothetical protein
MLRLGVLEHMWLLIKACGRLEGHHVVGAAVENFFAEGR